MFENLGNAKSAEDAEEMLKRTQEIKGDTLDLVEMQLDTEQILDSALARTITEKGVVNMDRAQLVTFLEEYGFNIHDVDAFLLKIQKVKFGLESFEKIIEEIKSTLDQN